MIDSIIYSLILTLVLELFLAVLLGIKEKKDIITIIMVNCFTNPIVVCLSDLAFIAGSNAFGFGVVAVMEILAFLFEGMIYSRSLEKKTINSYILSFGLNAFSFLVGILIETLSLVYMI